MTIFRSNYFHLKKNCSIYVFKIFFKYMLMYLTFSNLNSIHWLINPKKDIGLNVLFRTFSGHFMTIFRSNYFHLKKNYWFFIFVNYMLMYLTFSNLNSIHWIIKKKDIGLNVLFRTFHDNFQVKLYPPNFFFFFFFFNFRILNIGKPRPVLIFPDRQTSGSAGVNFRH